MASIGHNQLIIIHHFEGLRMPGNMDKLNRENSDCSKIQSNISYLWDFAADIFQYITLGKKFSFWLEFVCRVYLLVNWK